MNKKHLSLPKTLLVCVFMTLLHIIGVAGVYLIAEFCYQIPELLYFLPMAIPLIADLILRLKTDIKPFVTMAPAFVTALLAFGLVCLYPTGLELSETSSAEPTLFFVLSLINFAVRCFYNIIDTIILKRYKLLAVSVLVIAIGIGTVVGGFVYGDDIIEFVVNKQQGTPDQTGSWGAINQEVSRGENWQQIVKNSPFKLGEKEICSGELEEYNQSKKGSYPNIDGSTVCVPMAVEFARQHLGFDDKTANQFVLFSTTHYAYENLIYGATSEIYVHYNYDSFIDMGSTDLVIATEPSDEEIALAESEGITLIKKPVCYDAFVFITHKDNPVDSLTVEQIQKIYKGEITNWKDVGGKNEKIRAFQREKNSGSQTAMENLVMGGSDMIDPIEVKIIVGMGELIDTVAEYENETASLGYTYRYYIDTLYKSDKIKTIAVNGIAPTDENIRSESYPFTTNYYGVIKKGDEENLGGQFLNWIISEEGQKCVAQAGYISLD